MRSSSISYRRLVRTAVPACLAAALLSPAAAAQCDPRPLGAATDFNVFVFGDVHLSNSDVEGRLAVAGNAVLENYSVGWQIPGFPGDSLVVGGDLSFTNGSVKGNVVHGGSAAMSGVSITGSRRQDNPIDFAAEQALLAARSAFWATRAATGTATVAYGNVTLSGSDPDLNVFELTAAELAAANYLQIDAPAASTVLINVSGTPGEFSNMGFWYNGPSRRRVLYNFFEATELTIASVRVEGTILAPLADFRLESGSVEGNLSGFSAGGSAEPHFTGFIGCLPVE